MRAKSAARETVQQQQAAAKRIYVTYMRAVQWCSAGVRVCAEKEKEIERIRHPHATSP